MLVPGLAIQYRAAVTKLDEPAAQCGIIDRAAVTVPTMVVQGVGVEVEQHAARILVIEARLGSSVNRSHIDGTLDSTGGNREGYLGEIGGDVGDFSRNHRTVGTSEVDGQRSAGIVDEVVTSQRLGSAYRCILVAHADDLRS